MHPRWQIWTVAKKKEKNKSGRQCVCGYDECKTTRKSRTRGELHGQTVCDCVISTYKRIRTLIRMEEREQHDLRALAAGFLEERLASTTVVPILSCVVASPMSPGSRLAIALLTSTRRRRRTGQSRPAYSVQCAQYIFALSCILIPSVRRECAPSCSSPCTPGL